MLSSARIWVVTELVSGRVRAAMGPARPVKAFGTILPHPSYPSASSGNEGANHKEGRIKDENGWPVDPWSAPAIHVGRNASSMAVLNSSANGERYASRRHESASRCVPYPTNRSSASNPAPQLDRSMCPIMTEAKLLLLRVELVSASVASDSRATLGGGSPNSCSRCSSHRVVMRPGGGNIQRQLARSGTLVLGSSS